MTEKDNKTLKTLVIDIGGSNIKLIATGQQERIKIPSTPNMSAQIMVDKVKKAAHAWEYDRISIGCPSVIKNGQIVREPVNLGKGWVGFDFSKAFGLPCKILNDAAMQAYGCYHGGTMLFLGLGTGLGTTLIVDGAIIPMEAGHLPYRKKRSFEEYVGKDGLERLGEIKWHQHVLNVIAILSDAFNTDDVVIGGGNAKLLEPLPPHTRRTDNDAAFAGGFKLWQP